VGTADSQEIRWGTTNVLPGRGDLLKSKNYAKGAVGESKGRK